jgi:hypothetical protein
MHLLERRPRVVATEVAISGVCGDGRQRDCADGKQKRPENQLLQHSDPILETWLLNQNKIALCGPAGFALDQLEGAPMW